MGKKLRDEDLVLNVIINGDKAKKELGDLEQSTRELKNTNKDLRAEKEKLKRAGKQESARYKEITAELKANNATLKKNEGRIKELRTEMGVTGMTMVQLKREATRLNMLLNNSTYGTDSWKKYRAELDKVEAQMTKVKVKGKSMKVAFGKIADNFNKYTTMFAAVAAAITGVVFSIKKWIEGLATLDDALSDVVKTSGLMKKEVKEIYKDFKTLNTRTARRELLLLAEEAGRLGKKSKKDIMDFVEVANEISVALGDDLGDTQVAVREVGKLTNIYKVGAQYGTDFKESMKKMGSAINEVSANSSAQADYQIGYLKRMGGVASQAKINASEILGYASALDQLGQTQEMAATAHGKVMIDMFTDQSKYAKIAKMGTNEFLQLLKTDANEAFLKFLEGLNGNSEGLSVMAGKLDDLGIDGSRAVQVLSTLAANTALVRREQGIANKAMDEGISLTKEYNEKNNNTAGALAKIGQYVNSKFVNSTFLGWLEKVVGKTAEWVKVSADGTIKIEEKIKSLSKYKIVIIPIIAAIVAYKTAIKLATFWQNRNNTATTIGIAIQKAKLFITEANFAATQLWAAAQMLLTGNLKGATQAMRVFNATTKMNPIGAIVAIIVAAAAALYIYSKRVNEASAAQMELNKLTLNAKKSIVEQKVEMEQLLRIAKSEKRSKEDRIDALKKLNEISPKYLGNLTLENINTKEATRLTNLYIASLEKEARVKAAKERLVEIEKELLALRLEGAGAEVKWYQYLWNYTKAGGDIMRGLANNAETAMENYHNKENELLAKKKALLGELDKAPVSGFESTSPNGSGSEVNNDSSSDNLGAAQRKFAKLQQQLKDELAKASYANLKDGIEKEKALENQRWSEEKAKLEAKLITKKNLSAEEIAYNDNVDLLKEEKLQAHLTRLAELEKADDERKTVEKALKDAGQAELDLLNAETEEEEFQAKMDLAQARYDQEMALADKDRLKKLKAKNKYEKAVAKIDQNKEKRELDIFVKNKNITLAKLELASNALGVMRTLAGEESALGKALFIAQQAVAVGMILVNMAIANAKAVAASPLTFGQPWVTINTIAGGIGIASVLAQTITGLEQGGYSDVVRAQDGKQFRAQKRNQRGFVDKPSILVGEKDPEFVANGTAVKNPTVRPVLDVIDAAQRSGEIHTLDLPKVIQSMPSMRGLESGGYLKESNSSIDYSEISEADINLPELIQLNTSILQELDKQIKKGIRTYVVYGDIEDKMEEVETIKTAANL